MLEFRAPFEVIDVLVKRQLLVHADQRGITDDLR